MNDQPSETTIPISIAVAERVNIAAATALTDQTINAQVKVSAFLP
jgi:hypothetical protein